MHRRQLLSITAASAIPGCSVSTPLTQSSNHKIGETVAFDAGIKVTVTDGLTTQEMTLIRESDFQTVTDVFNAPTGGKYALFQLRVENSDITTREAPRFNIFNYETIEEEGGAIHIYSINDIRVFGSGEGGHLPDGHSNLMYDSISVDQTNLDIYSQSPSRPRIGADETLTGWVYGVIEGSATPELKIHFDGETTLWVA